MSKPLRVLLVEDLEDDALLLVRELRRGGFEPEWERVEDTQAMRAALADKTWDVILCDYSLPRFSAHTALELAKDLGSDLPVIVISGTVFDEQAGSLLKAGAHDFIRKDKLTRLVPAVEREMSEAKVRRERLRTEEALKESEERFRSLFELSPIGIWEEDYSGAKRIVDRLRKKGVRDFRRYFREHPKVLRQMAKAVKVIDINPALIDIYRASDKEAYLRAVTDSSRIEHWCRFYEQELATLAAGEDRVVLEHADKAYDGLDIVTRTITHIGEAYKDSWARVISTAEDITERRRAEEALGESEARYRDLFELSPLGIWEEDYSGVKHIIDRLRRKGVRDFRRYFRKHPEVLCQLVEATENIDVNQALLDIYRAPDKETFLRADKTDSSRLKNWEGILQEEMAALAAGESRVVLEYPEKTLDGSDIVVRVVTHIGPAHKDSWTRVVSTVEDITERKAMQAQLIQASKLSTLGEMATGIAHELNQPLSVIGMAAERAMDEFEGGDVDLEFISERLKQVIAQTERAAAIIDHTRMFGRLEEDKAPIKIDPRPAIEGALDTIGEQLRVLNIEVTTDIPHTCPPVLGHEVQLEQVVLNLLSNARDAIEANAARRGREGGPLGVIGVNVVVAEYAKEIKIVVRDTGDGIPEAVIDRVFDPFFTTKEKGEGLGLGLSIGYGIITDMGGRIEVANVEGGAEFTIKLPVA